MTNQHHQSSLFKLVITPNDYQKKCSGVFLGFSVVDEMNMQYSKNKLNKMSIFNVNKHHQKTIYSYFFSM